MNHRFPSFDLARREFLLHSGRIGLAGLGSIAGLANLAAAEPEAAIDDVPWLAEVQQKPATVPAPVPPLAPLLIDPNGSPIRSQSQWLTERKRLRAAWLDFLGPMPKERPPVKLQVIGEDRDSGVVRQLVRYESEPGLPVEGYLLRPLVSPPSTGRAGVVALHGTSADNVKVVAGVTGSEDRQLGLKLAQRGFVVFCPRCFLWQNAATYDEAVSNFTKRHPHTRGMHKMLSDAMRAVDVLLSLKPDVDAERIGATGHSLGAKETLYLSAFDDRIRAAVASEGGIGLPFTNWDAAWYLGEGIHAEDFKLNHHQLLALIAPKPFLMIAGEHGHGAADGDRSWPYVEAALPVYQLYGTRPRIGLYNHRQGHTVSPATFERLAEWLTTYLAPNAKK